MRLAHLTAGVAAIGLMQLGSSGSMTEVRAGSSIFRSATFPIASVVPGDMAQSLAVADIDGDGDPDVFAAGATGLSWYENDLDGTGSWVRHVIDVADLSQVVSGDVDGDGLADAVAVNGPLIVWWKNPGSHGDWTRGDVAAPGVPVADGQRIALGDLDGDGRPDVVGRTLRYDQSPNPIAVWWKIDESGTSWSENLISGQADPPYAPFSYLDLAAGPITVVDIEGDGDLDLLAPVRQLDLAYAVVIENRGNGLSQVPAWRWQSTLGESSAPTAVVGGVVADFDADGLNEILSYKDLGWYEWNQSCLPGVGGCPGPWEWIFKSFPVGPAGDVEDATAVDLDGDYDLDVVYRVGADVRWAENPGSGSWEDRSWPEHTVAALVAPAAPELTTARLASFSALTAPEPSIATFSDPSTFVVREAQIADVDGDGQLDLVAAGVSDSGNAGVAFWRNRGGQFALETSPLGPLSVGACSTGVFPVFAIDAYHRGRVGDSDVQLTAFAFRFADGAGQPLTTDQLRQRLDRLTIYAGDPEDGDPVANVTDLTLADGLLRVDLPPGDPRLTLPAPTSYTADSPEHYSVEIATRHLPAGEFTRFAITHVTEGGTWARDASTHEPLDIEYAPDAVTLVEIAEDQRPVARTKDLFGSVGAAIDPLDVDDGSEDDCGKLQYSVSPSSFTCHDLGANQVILTVTDVAGQFAQAAATVTITDDGSCSLDADADGVPDYLDQCVGTEPWLKVDGLGCTVDEDGDGKPDPRDVTAPSIALAVSPGVLWPPNHKLVPIAVNVLVDDDLDPHPAATLVSVTSSELPGRGPGRGKAGQTPGDGHTSDDVVVDADGTIWLRAERAGTGGGRVYTITYRATDAAGNTAEASATVTVPHDR